jgi:hypothetical protein
MTKLFTTLTVTLKQMKSNALCRLRTYARLAS